MARQYVRSATIFLASVFIASCVFMAANRAFAKIPEPDNIIYGKAGESVTSVTLKVDDETLVSYTMGDNPNAEDYYVLRVPMDALDPREPGRARPGDEARIYINSESVPAAIATIGEKGDIQRIDLAGTLDSDDDGLLDAEEAVLGTNPYNPDTDGDGLSDYDEANNGTSPLLSDSDGDGYSDGDEISAGTNPLDENDAPVIYVSADNTSGIEDGSKESPYNTIGEGIAAAPANYTVLVASGIYQEAVTIDRNIRLIGESPTTTIIDAGGSANAVYHGYAAGETSSIAGFSIMNASNGIHCDNGASPMIRNNIITGMVDNGIICSTASAAQIINNTIAYNTQATAIQSDSSLITIINNIVTDNNIGIAGNGSAIDMDYNNVWNNSGGNYVGCTSGTHDISDDPLFADSTNDNFHLTSDSPCLDAGDPVEKLTADYTGGDTISVDEVTRMAIGEMIWITDRTYHESGVVVGVTATTIQIQGAFMNDYLVNEGSYVFTDTSDVRNEPASYNDRIDMGAYGNTPEAGTILPVTTVDMILPSGWSMISIPVVPESTLVSNLFPGAVVVYGYEKGAGYVRVRNDENLAFGRGYWILLNAEKTYSLTGQTIPWYTKTVSEDGWEMIGGCTDPAQVIPHGCHSRVVYGYTQGLGYQRITGHLEQGKGYWILFDDVTDQAEMRVEAMTESGE